MHITSNAVSNILRDIRPEDKVSLFIVSTTTKGLSQLDLGNMSPEERLIRLQGLAQDNRFVAVVEKSDTVFAFVSNRFVEQLQSQQDLYLHGKKVSVETLSDSEYKRLAEVGQDFENFVIVTAGETAKEENQEEKSKQKQESTAYLTRDYLSLVGAKKAAKTDIMLFRFSNISEKTKMNMLQSWAKNRQEVAEHKKEQEKGREIVSQEIKKGIIKNEIEKAEVKKQDKRIKPKRS